jgi:hypothetical protein
VCVCWFDADELAVAIGHTAANANRRRLVGARVPTARVGQAVGIAAPCREVLLGFRRVLLRKEGAHAAATLRDGPALLRVGAVLYKSKNLRR